MGKETRISKILELLRRENGLPVQTLASQLGVSHMTIRRDLKELATEGTVRLLQGGVVLTKAPIDHRTESPYSLHSASAEHSEEKGRIGARAAELIADHDTLIIDSGSTTECLAMNVGEELNLTILTCAINILSLVAQLERVDSVITGGALHKNTMMFESSEGIALVRRFRATKAFISAAGITTDFGITCRNNYERETKRAAIESSAERILLADSSKFGTIRSAHFAELPEFDTIVTDEGIPQEYREAIADLGIRLILA